MSTKKGPGGGRPRKPPATRRGRLILAELDKRWPNLQEAADEAGLAYDTLLRVVHEADPGWLQVRTVAAVVERLGLPLELVAPCLGKLVSRQSGSAEDLVTA